jgi:hypothetical protein
VLKEKQPHDMADVLLSLKHAVVHPGQAAGQLSPCGNFTGSYNAGQQCSGQGSYQGPSASLSYTVHPHQVRSYTDEGGHNNINQQNTLAKQLPCAEVFPFPILKTTAFLYCHVLLDAGGRIILK